MPLVLIRFNSLTTKSGERMLPAGTPQPYNHIDSFRMYIDASRTRPGVVSSSPFVNYTQMRGKSPQPVHEDEVMTSAPLGRLSQGQACRRYSHLIEYAPTSFSLFRREFPHTRSHPQEPAHSGKTEIHK